MRWWVFILLPFHLLAQETYDNCIEIPQQTYSVNYDADKLYHWWVSGGEITSQVDNTITIQWPDSAGTYVIQAWTTRFGCEGDTSYHEIVIKNCIYAQLFFPNSFTPNKDGVNEVYQVKGRSADEIEYFAIYNRWGQRIFEAFENTYWDGEGCPTGIYTLNVFVKNNRYVKNITLIK
tara:strand:+ start:467 stop:997 length:531 start_codon:yes stop_codon:yes gene_type:complete